MKRHLIIDAARRPAPTRRRTRTGTRTRSSTRCACARSTTATATASATSRASRRSSTTCRTSASPRSGSCRSTRRRCATTATTSPTTPTSTTTSARSRTSSCSSTRRTRRGIRVITELVLNHTSDQHPWFQRARRAPPGSVERDFYVWSDTPERYREARIIFKDFEPSNWAWDPVARAYFWHRFYAHQPDLNFENPAVHEALLDVVDFWFGKGVDGLRLDAVPYLYEAEGTNCENLPATHAFLRSCARTSTRASPTACCSPRRTSGPRTPPPTSATATSAT